MKRIVLVAVLVSVVCGSIRVSATTVEELYREQLQASGGQELIDTLPEDTRQLMEALGIDALESDSFTTLDTNNLLRELGKLAAQAFREPLAHAALVMLLVLLCAWTEGLRDTLHSEETTTVFAAVCALALCGSVMLPLSQCIARVGETMTSVSVFMGSFTPVYAGVLLTDGRVASAASFQSVTLYVAQALSWFAGGVIVPLMTASLAMGLTGAVTPQIQLGGASKLFSKTAVWLLTFGTMLFTGLLSLQNMAGGAVDTLGARALKFSVARFVPVVGASLSEMFSTIRGCLHMLRSTLGCFGMAATALLILPPLLSCIGWGILLAVCHAASELFQLRAMSTLLDAARSTVRCLIGVLSACGSFLIIAVTVVTTAATGG